jgi:hypothetical protein
LFSDILPTIHLQKWPLEATLFDGLFLLGPVPTLFAEDPQATEASLKSNPEKVHYDLSRIARLLHSGETLNLTEACAFVKKPRAGTAHFPYKMPKYVAPVAEQPRGHNSRRTEESAPTSPKRRREQESESVYSQGIVYKQKNY